MRLFIFLCIYYFENQEEIWVVAIYWKEPCTYNVYGKGKKNNYCYPTISGKRYGVCWFVGSPLGEAGCLLARSDRWPSLQQWPRDTRKAPTPSIHLREPSDKEGDFIITSWLTIKRHDCRENGCRNSYTTWQDLNHHLRKSHKTAGTSSRTRPREEPKLHAKISHWSIK